MNKINHGYWKDKGLCVFHFFLLLIAPNVLPVMASLHNTGTSHVNECCHLHAQAASKGLSKQIALSGMNETPTMTGFCKWAIIHLRHNHIVAVSMLQDTFHLIDNFRIPSQVGWWTHSWVISAEKGWMFLMFWDKWQRASRLGQNGTSLYCCSRISFLKCKCAKHEAGVLWINSSFH